MFSNDRNIDKIEKLVESLREYLMLLKQSSQLSIIEKVVRLLTVITLTVILSFVFLLVVIFLSFTAAFILASFMPTWTAFLVLTVFYLLMFIIIFANRKNWIERPLVRMLTSILTE